MAQQFRPTSPHLSIYRFTLTMTLSIVHRVLGVGLYLGSVLFVLWLAAAAIGEDQLSAINGFFSHWLIQVGLFLYTWTLFHHMAGGIKHFIWDSINAFEPGAREAISAATLVFSALATVLVWAVFVWF